MNGLIKKVLIVACLSSSVAHTSQAVTWSQVGETTVQAASLAARATFCLVKGGLKAVSYCLPQDMSAKVAVGGIGFGMAAAYQRYPKIAASCLAIGACAGYLNYLYRDKRGYGVQPADEITPGGPCQPRVKYESEADCLKRVLRDRNNASSIDTISSAPSKLL